MKVLVVGAAGSLGSVVVRHLESETDWRVGSVTRDQFISDGIIYRFNSAEKAAWVELLHDPATRPDAVINTAAMTNVDACERERDHAWIDNVDLVARIADACRRNQVKFVHLSTDNVFDGKHGPYAESGSPGPINYYGKTKLASENECRRHNMNWTIVRTMWLYGGSGGKMSFVEWLAQELVGGRRVRIAQDEIGNPTLCEDVAHGIRRILEGDVRGVINLAGPEIISRLDVAYIVANWVGADPELIEPILSADLNRPALRPLQSGLLTLRAQALLGLRGTPLLQGLQVIETRKLREERGRVGS